MYMPLPPKFASLFFLSALAGLVMTSSGVAQITYVDADSNVGYWSVERWYGMSYYTVPELVEDAGFYGSPAHTEALTKSGVAMGIKFAGSRMRGYIQVEQDGEYYFWLSCRTSGNLMLSTDETPYRKRRIAYVGADAGTGHGIRYDSGNLWDVYASQMSEPVQLIAGQKYYLEVIHQDGHGGSAHIHVAWAKTGGERTLIARANMSSFPGQDGDADDEPRRRAPGDASPPQ